MIVDLLLMCTPKNFSSANLFAKGILRSKKLEPKQSKQNKLDAKFDMHSFTAKNQMKGLNASKD